MRTFRSWCAHVGRNLGKSVWIPQVHQSGKMHLHGVLWIPGADFAAGFNHDARARWVVTRQPDDLALWKSSRSPDLKRAGLWRRKWSRSYGLGFIDLCPFRPDTEPLAVARYVSRYVSTGGFIKGTRLVRRVGWKKGEDVPLRSNEFCHTGPRAALFGNLKEAGLRQGIQPTGKGWALKAAKDGLRAMRAHWPFTADEQRQVRERICGVGARHPEHASSRV